LEKEVTINAVQEPPGLLKPCCAVPPTDIAVVEVPSWGPGLVNMRLLLSVYRGPHPLGLPGRVVCSRPPL